MRSSIRRAVIAAGAVAVVLGTGAGVAVAAQAPVLVWSPPSPFGPLAPGGTASQVLTLKNTGGAASSALTVTVTPAAGTPASAFTTTGNTCTGTSLGPKKSCTVTITFTAPATPGSYQATLRATSKKPAGTASVTLAGTTAKATPAITTAAQPTVALTGDMVADQATVTGGNNPGGTVTFNLYTGGTCTAPPVFTDTENLDSAGTATSASYTTTAADAATGTEYWVATYNGDGNNNPVTSSCNGEPLTISACLVTDTTTGQAFPDLPDAVAKAGSGDTLGIQGTCTGTTEIGTSLTLTGVRGGTLAPTLDGGQQGSVLTIDQGVAVTLNALTITGGYGSDGGGGIANDDGTVTVNDSTITGNTTSSSTAGGGIANDGGAVTLNNTTVTDNTAPGFGLGGGIDNGGGTVTLSGTSTITGNSAGELGGGIYEGCGGTLNNAVAGTGGNVYNNTPDDIVNQPDC